MKKPKPKKIVMSELIYNVKKHDIAPPKFIEPILKLFLEEIRTNLLAGHIVDLAGVGGVFAKPMPERKLHSVFSKDVVILAPRKVLKIQPYPKFKEDLSK